MTNPNKKEDWEDWLRNEIRNELPLVFVQDAEDEIVSTFRKLLSQKEKEVRREMIGIAETLRGNLRFMKSNDDAVTQQVKGYGVALTDIINKLKEKDEK